MVAPDVNKRKDKNKEIKRKNKTKKKDVKEGPIIPIYPFIVSANYDSHSVTEGQTCRGVRYR